VGDKDRANIQTPAYILGAEQDAIGIAQEDSIEAAQQSDGSSVAQVASNAQRATRSRHQSPQSPVARKLKQPSSKTADSTQSQTTSRNNAGSAGVEQGDASQTPNPTPGKPNRSPAKRVNRQDPRSVMAGFSSLQKR
jgi:hypothetical protein